MSSPVPNKLNLHFVNESGLPDDQVLITFQGAITATYGPNGSTVAPKSKGDLMSESFDLTKLGKEGLYVSSAVSTGVFVSYASTAEHGGFQMSGDLSGPIPPSYVGKGGGNYYKAYQPFEITYTPHGGQGNLTNINYFGSQLSLQSYNGGTGGTPLQKRSYNDGVTTASLSAEFTALAPKATATTEDGAHDLRHIGPSSYGAEANPFPAFDAYLTSLSDTKQKTTISNQNAFITPGPNSLNYNFTLDFVATIGADFTITLSGAITTMIFDSEGSKSGPSYEGLQLTISPTIGQNTSKNIFTNTIYGQADPLGLGRSSTTFNDAWEPFKKDVISSFGNPDPFTTTQSLLIGEITTGLLGGFCGSSLQYTNGKGEFAKWNGQLYKDVPTNAWWKASVIPSPSTLQPTSKFYNEYAQIIFNESSNLVYSIPYSDRFGAGPLMECVMYDNQVVDTWVVTVGRPTFLK